MLLLKNNQGQLVKKLQQKLSELDFNVGPIDGVFGPKTESAVIKFQKRGAMHFQYATIR